MIQTTLPDHFYLLEQCLNHSRPNRLCICLSDLHFTDGSVGNQSAEVVVWQEVFNDIVSFCTTRNIKELTLILDGDIADMIRTAKWTQAGVYPWERDKPEFKTVLQHIIKDIIVIHACPAKPCFFTLLKQLPSKLTGCTVNTIALLGNHDKELLADEESLKMFYEQCLGQPIKTLSPAYRQWIGKMYFNDENYYIDKHPERVPRLPFYWGDIGFRLFVTHGQWRDEDNSRCIARQDNKKGWKVSHGWQLKVWQDLDFSPFTQACFGDTVAAGVLSGFIYRTKEQLNKIKANPSQTNYVKEKIAEIERLLDELDLYRPTYLAVQRIIQIKHYLRNDNKKFGFISDLVEHELLNSIHQWLKWDFTFKSTTSLRRLLLRGIHSLMDVLERLGTPVEPTTAIDAIMKILTLLREGFFHSDTPSYRELCAFPSFLTEYRQCGFHIHGEGHTHIPLQAELNFVNSTTNPNYTYVNFGTWRDQIVAQKKSGYKRRGVGRALYVIDLQGNPERFFGYWVKDVVHWDTFKIWR